MRIFVTFIICATCLDGFCDDPFQKEVDRQNKDAERKRQAAFDAYQRARLLNSAVPDADVAKKIESRNWSATASRDVHWTSKNPQVGIAGGVFER